MSPDQTPTVDALVDIWQRIQTTHPAPPWWLTVACILTSLALVLPYPAWRVVRNAVTIAHEGGHALAGFLVGRRLDAIRLHADTSGVTVSSGRAGGPGMVFTAFAGYVAPALLGLGGVALVSTGLPQAALWATLVLLGLMALLIRNLYGLLTMAATGGLVFAITWWAPGLVQNSFAAAAAWFLLVAAPRPVVELHLKRRHEGAPGSDADQLAELTGIPGGIWVALFGLVNLGCLGVAAHLALA